jgi:hypothetical protein
LWYKKGLFFGLQNYLWPLDIGLLYKESAIKINLFFIWRNLGITPEEKSVGLKE